MRFGDHIRALRESKLAEGSKKHSLRKVAEAIGVQPTYLSKIERNEFPPPSEKVIIQLAQVLEQDPDVLLGLAGKVREEVQAAIAALFVKESRTEPEDELVRAIRQVRDGKW